MVATLMVNMSPRHPDGLGRRKQWMVDDGPGVSVSKGTLVFWAKHTMHVNTFFRKHRLFRITAKDEFQFGIGKFRMSRRPGSRPSLYDPFRVMFASARSHTRAGGDPMVQAGGHVQGLLENAQQFSEGNAGYPFLGTILSVALSSRSVFVVFSKKRMSTVLLNQEELHWFTFQDADDQGVLCKPLCDIQDRCKPFITEHL
jgi:hypothetical protein